MPGSGKTTLGRKLAIMLDYRFVDGDDLIKSTGRSLQQIIDSDGEEEFFKIEEKVLSNVQGERMVIAPGGSCVMSDAAMQHLRAISFLVFIDVPLKILERRLVDAQQRGIIGLRNHSLEELYMIRRPLYECYAHATVAFLDDYSDSDASFAILRRVFGTLLIR